MRSLKLKKPIAHGELSAPITELSFREEVVAGDLRGVAMREPMMFEDLLKIAGRLCGQPEAVMQKLSVTAGDMNEVLQLVGNFMSGGQPTGSEQSP